VRYNPKYAMLITTGLSRHAQLAHRRLCDYIWSGGPRPRATQSEAGQIAQAPRSAWPQVLEELLRIGWRVEDDHLTNATVQAGWTDAVSALETQRARSQAGHTARWNASGNASSNTTGTPSANTTGNADKIREEMKEKIDIAINPAERLTLSGSSQEMPVDGENGFLEDLSAALGQFSKKQAVKEMTNWGGWWRNRYRENPDKARRILAELAGMIRERKIKRNPGAVGLDLWGRTP
jgi:hypothetical protein